MKQHISEKQLGELTSDSKKELMAWWDRYYRLAPIPLVDDLRYGGNPLLSIGQMIQFLLEYQEVQIDCAFDKETYRCTVESPTDGDLFAESEELCDALWNAVKYVLIERRVEA